MGSVRGTIIVALVVASLLLAGTGLAGEVFLVIDRPGVHKVVRQAVVKAGHKARDVGQEHDYFVGISALTTGNLGAPRPGFLTGPVLAAWDEGMAACRARAGDPPWNMKNKHAFLCGRALGRVLWQRFLDAAKPEFVIAMDVRRERKDGPVILEGQLHAPGESTARHLSAGPMAWKKVHPAARKMARALLKGKGRSQPRALERDLPEAPFSPLPGKAGIPVQLQDGKVLDLPAIGLPVSCTAGLPALAIEPAKAPLAETILRLYVKSAAEGKQSGKLLRCELGIAAYKIMAGVRMRRWDGTLRCGKQRFEAGGVGITPAHAHKKIANGLVQAILRSACNPAAR